jgi:hypothetical protein
MKTNPRLARLTLAIISVLAATTSSVCAQPGVPVWTNRYNGPGNGDDSASAIALDASGNVIVTGYSTGSGSSSDYTTIKYSSAGAPLWTNRYNGTGNSFDGPIGLVVDANSNIIVTGFSYGAGTIRPDYLTLKYSSAGVPLWTNRYIGPTSDDYAEALAMDTNSNVYVTGYSMDAANSGWEYATLKYSSAGVPLWTNRLSRSPRDAGQSCTLAVDSTGTVLLVGNDAAVNQPFILAYSSAGVALWTNSVHAVDMVLDAADNWIVIGVSTDTNGYLNYMTVKYSNAGVPLWTNYYDGPVNRQDAVAGVAVDAGGNVIVTGWSKSTSASYDYGYATIKYSSAGIPLWTNRYDEAENFYSEPSAVAVDASGNVYVTGYSGIGINWFSNYATIAYSSAGVPLWTNRCGGPGNSYNRARALVADSRGNVYVTGGLVGSGGSLDFTTIKYAGVPPAAPVIMSHPSDRTNITGTTATFTMAATGDAPLKYQWRKGGANLLNDSRISGVTTTNLVIANIQPSDAGDYSVIVTNFAGSVTSLVAQLTVISPGRLSDVSYWPSLGLFFVFRDGTVGRSYRIQTATSLTQGSWSDWVSFNYTAPLGFIDVVAPGGPSRFYRAVSP